MLAASEHSLVLKEINVPLWSHDTCNGALQAQFGPAYHLPDTAVCAGAEGRDACDVSLLFYTQSLSEKHCLFDSASRRETCPILEQKSFKRFMLQEICQGVRIQSLKTF